MGKGEFNLKRMGNRFTSENELVSRIRCGDQFAVEELFRMYYSSLCRFAQRMVHSREDVEDIVEAVFERLWFNRGYLNPNQSIRSYLFKAVQNKAIDFLRGKGNKQMHFEEEETAVPSSSDPVQEAMDRELASAIAQAIEKLPRKCKFVFTLNRQDGLTYAEIADLLGISEKTVENQIGRAFRLLRKRLKSFLE